MEALLLLALLACPVGMGLMMWFMAKGMMGGKKAEAGGASLADLKAEQARLSQKIGELESADVAVPVAARKPAGSEVTP